MANYFDQFDQPSALVGAPANGTKYSPEQMQQLNAARDALRAAEARGDPGTYGAEGKQQANYFDQFDAAPATAANADKALGGTLQLGVPFTNARLDTGIPLPADVEAGLVGAGKTVADWINGARQALPGSNAALDARVKADEAAYAPLAKEHPVATTIGEIAPYLASGNSIAGAAGLSALGYGTPEERAMRAGLAAGGATLGKGVARLMGGPASMAGVPNAATDFADYAASAGNKFGIPTTVGMNGSKTAKLAESVIANMPFVNGGVNRAREAAYQGFNRAVSNTFGENSAQITPQLLGDALNRSGEQIGGIMQRANAQLTPDLAQRVAQLSSEVADLGPEGGVVANKIGRFIEGATNGEGMSGQALRKFDSSLGRVMGSTQNGDVRYAAGALQEIVRDAAAQSLSDADNAALRLARQQNFNVRQVADAAKNGSLSPSQLLTQVNSYQRRARYGGGNDLAELAQWAKPILTDQIPNSGTPQRQLMQRILTNPVTGIAELGALGYAADEHPYAAGGLGLLAPLLVGRTLAGKPVSEVTRRLLTATGGGLGGLLAPQ